MDIQTVSIVLAGIGIFIAAINSIISSREAKRQRQTEIETRQAEMFMRMYDRWSSPEFRLPLNRSDWPKTITDAKDWMNKYGNEADPEGYVKSVACPASFMEGIGVLVERGLIDVTLVDRLMYNTITGFWEYIHPVIYESRKMQKPDQQPHFDSFEHLYNLIKAKE